MQLKYGDMTKYRRMFLKENPQVMAGVIPQYITKDFEKYVKKEGAVSIDTAFKWVVDTHLESHNGPTTRSYKNAYRRLFDYICNLHNCTFEEPVEKEEIIIHYSLEEGIIDDSRWHSKQE